MLQTVRTLISGLEERCKPSTVMLEDFTKSCSAASSDNSALLLDGLTVFINRYMLLIILILTKEQDLGIMIRIISGDSQ